MPNKINNTIELCTFIFAGISGSFFSDAILNIVVTALGIVLGTIGSHFVKKYLDRKK